MSDSIIVEFERMRTNERFDMEIPKDITANDLVKALNIGLSLGINMDDVSQCYLMADNPLSLLRGETTIEEYGLYDGSKVIFDR